MNQKLLALLLLLTGAPARAQGPPPPPAAPQVRAVAGFRALDVTDGIQLFVRDGRQDGVQVEAPAPLRDRLKTVVEGSVLKVSFDALGPAAPAGVLKVYVTTTGLNALQAAKGAAVTFEHSPTRGGTLAVRLLSGARLTGDVQVTLLDVQLRGGATAQVTGVASHLHVRAVEGSAFQGPDLHARQCRAFAANASTARFAVEQSLEAEAQTDAVITYSGPAVLAKDVRGPGGKILHL